MTFQHIISDLGFTEEGTRIAPQTTLDPPERGKIFKLWAHKLKILP